ncbi:MAG: L-seryl-tRNA(Sec) selenium transferase [Halioglobus sp.]|nr:L-seryl-tRNA(Sec) selenium transferase [Halioglobus sp.]
MTADRDIRSELPSVDRVLQASQDLVSRCGHRRVSEAIREHLRDIREGVKTGQNPDWSIPAVHSAINSRLSASDARGIRPVINLSGIVLHTNLGRACLPAAAAEAACQAAMFPNNLEYDLETGKRGNRDSHVESLICELTGCEAATVVNNNAAAVVLALSTLARGLEVPVSRGELVEIGGSFRVPEVMESSGCTLVEVGATNRTHLKDYRCAISTQTALLMKVHTSNYRLEGFTHSVDEKTLAELAHEHGLPCMVDLGSGCLVDFTALGLPGEPQASEYIANGVDLITFSGDKLLGGPQCGIIAGKKSLIERICRNPLKRALRVDSMILAALSEVLKLYRHPEQLTETLPTLRQLTRPAAEIEAQALRLCAELASHLPHPFRVATAPCLSQVGSGALPIEAIPSFAIAIESAEGRDSDLRSLATELRRLPRPVIGRIHDGSLLLDLRCLDCESLFLQQLPQLRDALSC